MNDGGRKKCRSATEEKSELLNVTQNKVKINRLKRSPKCTQSQKPDFTTCRAETGELAVSFSSNINTDAVQHSVPFISQK